MQLPVYLQNYKCKWVLESHSNVFRYVQVTVVFHGAATINFADPLQLATNINVKGTLEMLEFGKACKNLR